jgi:transposase
MSYAQLTREERYVIAHLKMFKLSIREIARRLNRHHSTISRELKRNGPDYSQAGCTGTTVPRPELLNAKPNPDTTAGAPIASSTAM